MIISLNLITCDSVLAEMVIHTVKRYTESSDFKSKAIYMFICKAWLYWLKPLCRNRTLPDCTLLPLLVRKVSEYK